MTVESCQNRAAYDHDDDDDDDDDDFVSSSTGICGMIHVLQKLWA